MRSRKAAFAINCIARQHGGFIDVHSALGQGAIFTILLPLADSTFHD